MGHLKIVSILTLLFTTMFVVCLGMDVSMRVLIGVGFFSLYFLVIAVAADTDNVIRTEIKKDRDT